MRPLPAPGMGETMRNARRARGLTQAGLAGLAEVGVPLAVVTDASETRNVTRLMSSPLAAGDRIGSGQGLAAQRLQVDLGAMQSTGHPFDDPPLPDRCGVETGANAEPPGPLVRVALEQLDGIAADDRPEIALGLGQQTVGIDELESLNRSECIELVYVTMDQNRPFVIVSRRTTVSARERVVDRPLRTGMTEALP